MRWSVTVGEKVRGKVGGMIMRREIIMGSRLTPSPETSETSWERKREGG